MYFHVGNPSTDQSCFHLMSLGKYLSSKRDMSYHITTGYPTYYILAATCITIKRTQANSKLNTTLDLPIFHL